MMKSKLEQNRLTDTVATKVASELDRPARQWLQKLFGRSLAPDEQVTFFVTAPHSAPSAADRSKALRRADSILDRAAANMQDVPDGEIEEALEEAMHHVRKRTD